MPKHGLGLRQGTHPLIWCCAIVCTLLSIAVIIVGLIVFVGYLIIRPKVPSISVTDASLGEFAYDQAGLLTTQITIIIRAENDNAKAHASFYNAGFDLSFHGLTIAKLMAERFNVRKNSSIDFRYPVESSPIPLDPRLMEIVDASLKENKISFDLKGHVRTRWRVGIVGSVKFWCRLSCQLQFRPSNKSYLPSYCSSKSK